MYWAITVLWTILGLVSCWVILSNKWNKIDRLTQLALQTARIYHPIPGDENYLDLKFSVLRHSFFFALSSVLIYFIKSDFWLTVILIICLLYHGYMTVKRYRYRKKELESASSMATKEVIKIPINDSFVVIVHAIACLVFTYVLYGVRP
jgi:hypothetical protein